MAPPTLPTSYPRTVNGLLSALDPLPVAEFRAIAGEIDKLARRLKVKPAAELARQLAGTIRQLPAVVVALRSLTSPAVLPATDPAFIPDPVDPLTIRDAGTGLAAADPTQRIVPWWPALPAGTITAGAGTLADVDVDELDIRNCRGEHQNGRVTRWTSSPCEDLISYAGTVGILRSRDAGYHQLARGMRGGGRPAQSQLRRSARAIATAYRDHLLFLEPIGDLLAAQIGAYIETTWSVLTALADTEGETMPTLTQSAVITSLATRIRDAITTGHGGRLQVSDAEQAFAWAPGPAVTLLSFLGTDTVDGRRTTVVTAKDSATPVGPVAEGGTKNNVVDFTSDEVDLLKFPGQATISVEASQFTKNIETAVATVITGQIVRAIEADAAGVIDAGAGVVIAGAADITAGVLAAIAAIRGNGGAPNVVGLNAADWIEVMQATGASGYLNFSSPEQGPAGTWLGLAPVIVPDLAAGAAIVLDGRSVTVSEPAGGPLCIVDPFTQAKNNKIVITVEAWAQSSVGSPGGVATVAVTP